MEIVNKPINTITTMIGSVTSVVLDSVLGLFEKDYFNHIFVSTKNIGQVRKDTTEPIIKFRTPALAISPSYDPDTDTYKGRLLDRYMMFNLICDNDAGIDITGAIDVVKMSFDIKIKVETGMKVYDTVAYLRYLLSPDKPFLLGNKETELDVPIPNNVLVKLMTLLGLNYTVYENVDILVDYLNKYSSDGEVVFCKKFNLSTGRYMVSFTFKQNIFTIIDGNISMELGKNNNVTSDNYVGFRLICEVKIPSGFRLFLDEEKKVMNSYVNFVNMYKLLHHAKDLTADNVYKVNAYIYDLLYKTSNTSVIEDNLFYLLTNNKFVSLKKKFDELMGLCDFEQLKLKLMQLSESYEYVDFVNEVKSNLSGYFSIIEENDSKTLVNLDISPDYNLLPDYMKAIVDAEMVNSKVIDKFEYPYDNEKSYNKDFEFKYESALIGSKDKVLNKDYMTSPFNTDRKLIIDYYKYNDLLNHVTRDMLMDNTNILSPFNPTYELINLPVNDLLNPNNVDAITNPDNPVSPFNIANGLMDYPDTDFRSVRLTKWDILNPKHPRSLFNPNNKNSPYNNADLLNLPHDDINSPFNITGLTCPLSPHSPWYVFKEVNELNNSIKNMKNPVALTELPMNDLLNPNNVSGITNPNSINSPFHPFNGLTSKSFVFVDDISEMEAESKKQSVGNKEVSESDYLIAPEETVINNLVNQVNSSLTVETKIVADYVFEDLRNKFVLGSAIIAKPEDFKNGKNLYYYNAYVTDINVLIDTLDLSSEINIGHKSIINYYLSDKKDINDLFTVYVYGRNQNIERSRFNMNWYTYKISIATPKINNSYYVAIYYNKQLFDQYAESYRSNISANI